MRMTHAYAAASQGGYNTQCGLHPTYNNSGPYGRLKARYAVSPASVPETIHPPLGGPGYTLVWNHEQALKELTCPSCRKLYLEIHKKDMEAAVGRKGLYDFIDSLDQVDEPFMLFDTGQ